MPLERAQSFSKATKVEGRGQGEPRSVERERPLARFWRNKLFHEKVEK